MPENTRMSRRDWFRLRPSRSQDDNVVDSSSANVHKPIMGQAQEGLRPVAFPENHGGMNLAELPPMRESLLSDEQVQQLFSDIESLASDVLLMQRTSTAQRTSVSSVTTVEQLNAAKVAILSGTISRAQIRYRWENANWIDTLERTGNSYRLVRIQHQIR